MRRAQLNLSLALSILGAALFLKLAIDAKTPVSRTPSSLAHSQASFHGKSLKAYSFGFENFIASLLWIRLLQKHDTTPIQNGAVSWEFAELDAITDLDPKFDPAYRFGSLFLSVLRRDQEGGKYLLEKWVHRSPTDYFPYQMLGMHYYEELGDYERAAPYILRASQMQGAPLWLSSLGIRFLSETGTEMNALTKAISLAQATVREEEQAFLLQRILALRYSIEKRQWNEALKKFQIARHQLPTSLAELTPYLENNSRSIASVRDNAMPANLVKALSETFSFTIDPKEKIVIAENRKLDQKLSKTGIYVEPSAVKRRLPEGKTE